MRTKQWITGLRLATLVLLVGIGISPIVAAAAPARQDGEDPALEDGDGISDFCTDTYLHPATGLPHPVGSRLSDEDPDLYNQVMDWFCVEGMGFGQIKLALMTERLLGGDGSAQELLDRRAEGEGWGQIWLDLDLIGWGRRNAAVDSDAEDAPDTDEVTEPGPPDHAGRPDHAGPKESHVPPGQVGKDDHGGGPPDHASSRHNR